MKSSYREGFGASGASVASFANRATSGRPRARSERRRARETEASRRARSRAAHAAKDEALTYHGGVYSHEATGSEEARVSDTITYTVPAMHCAHCKQAVTDEVSTVAGVEGVDVDVETKLVVVRGSGLDDAALREAI